MLCAIALVAYAGAGSFACYTSSSVCDGKPQERCTGACFISQADAAIYCCESKAAYKCVPLEKRTVTLTTYAGVCQDEGGACSCIPLEVVESKVLPNQQVYTTKGPNTEV